MCHRLEVYGTLGQAENLSQARYMVLIELSFKLDAEDMDGAVLLGGHFGMVRNITE